MDIKFRIFASQERISNIAYNIVNGICTPISDPSAPVYITIGDGGNLEGLVTEYVPLLLVFLRYKLLIFSIFLLLLALR